MVFLLYYLPRFADSTLHSSLYPVICNHVSKHQMTSQHPPPHSQHSPASPAYFSLFVKQLSKKGGPPPPRPIAASDAYLSVWIILRIRVRLVKYKSRIYALRRRIRITDCSSAYLLMHSSSWKPSKLGRQARVAVRFILAMLCMGRKNRIFPS